MWIPDEILGRLKKFKKIIRVFKLYHEVENGNGIFEITGDS